MSGHAAKEDVFILRMKLIPKNKNQPAKLIPKEGPFDCRRVQFQIGIILPMNINKSQGSL